MNEILILVDYKNKFWLRSDYREASIKIENLKEEFEKLGYIVSIDNFSNINFKNKNYDGTIVIYQSSQDPGLFYKSYIEDILLGLRIKGAILVPDFIYFRAHHNKLFMEILRDVNVNSELKSLKSSYYGIYEDYLNNLNNLSVTPKVFKLSDGDRSENVSLLTSKKEFISIPYRKTRTFNLYYLIADKVKPFLKKKYPHYRKKSHNRRKFIVQDYIADLEGDFKILVYGNKYFVLSRKTRLKDFRASGSGRFSYSTEVPESLLTFSKQCLECFNVPFISLDVAMKNDKHYLFEFQFVHFGNYTLEYAPHYFTYEDNKWQLVESSVVLEQEFALAVHSFINRVKNENIINP